MIIERCLQCNRFKDDDAILCDACYDREKFLSLLRDLDGDLGRYADSLTRTTRASRARERFDRLVRWALGL